MIELEIDGKPIQVAEGASVIEAANKLGIYVPHFCYHKKLSIAANCRMCLVEVEKAPKPLPACATPATNGMKVHTHSSLAVDAQKAVMEFLLINHPLDCPVCDEGGECQLQDLAVGYGASNSRYDEFKRSVPNKFLGPLIATEMTRCIQCTRCVRFGVEIAGIMELGMVGRGEAEEIVTFVGRTVDSELSGNMIDVCPVGALTSKPFRFRARPWELQNKRSVSPHCGLGSNLIVQTKLNRVYRVLPFENEAINETWLSDKDRFSYEGLNSSERLTQPMVKRDGEWRTCDWPQAFTFIASRLQAIRERGGAEHIGALATPYQTLEELYLLQKLVRAIGSGNIDFRLRQCDFALDEKLRGAPWLGMSVASLSELKRVLFVGTNLRKDHQLIAARIRQAEKRGAQVSLINAFDNDLLMPVAHNMIVAPSMMADALAEVINGSANGLAHPIATSLRETPSAILLGNLAQHHPQSSRLHQLAQQLAQQTGAQFGYLGEAANSVGGYLARATPLAAKPNGLDANNMLARPRRAYLLLGVEPELDCHNPSQAMDAMRQAELVVSMSAYKHRAIEYAHVLLPISPFSETAGTFVNTEGRAQSFNAAAPPLGETRPAWKVLRVIGNHLKLPEFGYDTIEEIRAEVAASKVPLDNTTLHDVPENRFAQAFRSEYRSIERIADVSIYSADAIVRRSPPLRETADARDPVATMRGALMERMGIADGDTVRLTQNGGQAVVIARRDDRLPENCIRVAGGHRLTSDLGSMFGDIAIERVTPEKMAQR